MATYDDWKAADPDDAWFETHDFDARCEVCDCTECRCEECPDCGELPVDCTCAVEVLS